MVDTLKKALFAGIGMAVMTRDKVEEIAKKIAADSNITEQEGRKFVDEVVKKSEDAKASLEKLVHENVDKVFTKLDIPTREQVKKLEERIRELEGGKHP